MYPRTRRSPARFLGPLALIAVVVALAAVVTGSGNGGGASSPADVGTTQSSQSAGSKKTPKTTTVASPKGAGPKTYVVKLGDSLSSIADQTGVTLERLQELNPDVDSHLMTAGQKIRLR